MRNMRILAALGLLAAAAAANAEVSGSAAIVSDYDFRGFTQTNNDATVQLSIDYTHESGWYIGTWGSGVDFGDPKPSTEVDVYTGYAGSIGDLGYDVGINYYAYPGASDLNFAEIYGSLSYSVLTAGLYYSNDFGGSDESGIYVYADVSIPAGPLSIDLHAGLSDGDGVGATYFFDDDLGRFTEDSYTDYSIGLSYTANNFTIGLKWIALDAGDAGSDDRVVLSFSTSFPWE
jgi:uncharacterized protein (TIGR02001 family)